MTIFLIRALRLVAALAFVAQLSGCGGGSSSSTSTAVSEPNAAGKALYDSVCFACHGSDGGGRFARISIRDLPAGRISRGIANVPSMYFLDGQLSSEDLANLEQYLAWLPATSNPERLTATGDAGEGEALFRTNCTGCHALDTGSTTRIGPDLFGHSDGCADATTSRTSTCERLMAFIAEPQTMATHAYSATELEAYPYTMPDLNLSDLNALDIATYIGQQDSPLVPTFPVMLDTTAFNASKEIYFNRCAGCHGLYRAGATGPAIGEAESIAIGTDGLAAMMRHGTPGGMPNFGTAGILSEAEITDLAAYLQLPPPAAPALGMAEIAASWELTVPVASRPAAPQHTRDWENFFGVVLRDDGKVAIFDGDTHEEIARVDVGFAVHILRSSASGRYFYAIGRDGWVNMIDLWASPPNVVAKVRGCHDARSVESSKFTGYEDNYLIEGCYWPPQYVVYDGLTLEPQSRVDLPMTDIDGAVLDEVRVAAIIASHEAPEWVINQKETGYVGIIDYAQAGAPLALNIPTVKFLHDGGWDHTQRYFITAANASNTLVVVDVQNRTEVATIEVGTLPHPGRGANWKDPTYGWVNATPHLGSPFVSVYGADPVNDPDNAWKVVRQIALPAAGSLFIKTHPASPWVLVDMTMDMDSEHNQQICAIAKATGTLERCFDIAIAGKAVHMEFNADGSEVWISDWASEGGGQVILDSKTLEVKERIILPATTGKFNVHNTAQEIY